MKTKDLQKNEGALGIMVSKHSAKHGKWSKAGVPHTGWEYVEHYDLREPSEICEMCEKMEIRYVHVLQHEDYPEKIHVGRVCAEKMENDRLNPSKRETALINRRKRKVNWLKRSGWRVTRYGNPCINTDGFKIVVYPLDEGWETRILHKKTGDDIKKKALTEKGAKMKAFKAMMDWKEKINKEKSLFSQSDDWDWDS